MQIICIAFFVELHRCNTRKNGERMAKGKYEYWLTPEGLLKLEGWARDGLTDEQIAENMSVGIRTLYEWKQKYPQISQSLKRGKEVVDLQVENALLKRALGYSYTETTKELIVDKNTGKSEMRVTKTVEKEVVPDTTAQIFWLKNRKPDKWRDKQDVQISGELKSEQSKLDSLIRQMRGDG